MIKPDVLRAFSGCQCLVTGGTGLIGRQVVKLLCDAGARVRVVSLDRLTVDSRAEHCFADLTDFTVCRNVTRGMDAVFHLAGIKGSIEVTKSKPASFFVPLLMFNTNLLEACRLNGVPRVVYTSSIGAYPSAEVFTESDGQAGEPMDQFPGWAKRMAELQIKAYAIQYGLTGFSVVRPCNVYGPGDNFDPANAMVIPTLMYRIAQGENPVVVWGDGTAIRDFAFSRDVAEGILLAAEKYNGAEPVNLGSGYEISVKDLVEMISRLTGFQGKLVWDTSKPNGQPRRGLDVSRAEKYFGFRARTSFEDGLRRTIDWYREHRK